MCFNSVQILAYNHVLLKIAKWTFLLVIIFHLHLLLYFAIYIRNIKIKVMYNIEEDLKSNADKIAL